VGGIAASTLNLQDGIANMAGESVVLDAYHAVSFSSFTTFHILRPPPLLLLILHSFSHSYCLFLRMPTLHSCSLISFITLVLDTTLHCTALHCTTLHCTTLYYSLIRVTNHRTKSLTLLPACLSLSPSLYFSTLQLTARRSLWCW
jgi:hypothetical protein